MKKLCILLAILLALLTPIAVLASDVSSAIYQANITISNNGSALWYVLTTVSLNSSAMIDVGYMTDNASDTAIVTGAGADTAYMPSVTDGNPWIVYVPAIGEDTSLNYILYTGGEEDMAGQIRYFPASSGMSANDSATLELSDNFTVEYKALVNTSTTNGELVAKPSIGGANHYNYRLYISGTGNITSELNDGASVVTASGLDTIGEYEIKSTFDGAQHKIYIDDVEKDSDNYSTSIVDEATSWNYSSNASTVYLEYVSITINGTQQQYISWQYNDDYFTDQSGNGHNTDPTFRTTGNAAGTVSASLSSFQPVSTAEAPPYTITDASPFYTANITTSGNFTSGNVTPGSGAGGPPGVQVISDVAEAGGTPNIWVWGILAIFLIAGGGLFLTWMERRFGGGGGTILLRIGYAVLIFGLLITFNIFDWWMLILYMPIAMGFAMASRHIEWGGNISQHGLIGFLSQSFIGLTIINRILEGQFLTTNERLWANYFAFTQEFRVFDIFTMPVLNFSFFTHGIPSLVNWDYSFFGGNAQLIQYLLYSITAMLTFVIFTVIIALLYNAFRVR